MAAVAALTVALGTGGTDAAVAAPPEASPAAHPKATAAATAPLAPRVEAARAREATRLYGDLAVRPLAERKTSLISLGDSEISGEGVGTYEPGTNGPDNWCHRSPDSASTAPASRRM